MWAHRNLSLASLCMDFPSSKQTCSLFFLFFYFFFLVILSPLAQFHQFGIQAGHVMNTEVKGVRYPLQIVQGC